MQVLPRRRWRVICPVLIAGLILLAAMAIDSGLSDSAHTLSEGATAVAPAAPVLTQEPEEWTGADDLTPVPPDSNAIAAPPSPTAIPTVGAVPVEPTPTPAIAARASYRSPEQCPELTLASVFPELTSSAAQLRDGLLAARYTGPPVDPYHHQLPSLLDPSRVTTLVVTGDIMPGRNVDREMTRRDDFRYPFEKTASLLGGADLAFGDLEAPLIADCAQAANRFVFCGKQRFVEGLRLAGIDVLSLANNHIGNYGQGGIRQTEKLLAENGIGYTGPGRTVVREIKGLKWAFLGFTGVGPRFNREAIQKAIAEARKMADVVVVAPHWGKEYTSVPESDALFAPDDPLEIAHLMIDAGADLVIGNHPHWVQGVEIYRGKFIAYAHGNFIFDQTWSQATTEGVIGKYTFYGTKLIDVRFYPILIEANGQPHFLVGEAGLPILRRMRESSDAIARLP